MFKCLFVSFLFLVAGFFAGAFVGTQHPGWLNCCGHCPACFCPAGGACPVKCQCDNGKACACTKCECANCKCCCCPGK